MINFVEAYMSDKIVGEYESFDEQKVLLNAMCSVLPLILENELTQRQRVCLNLFYVHGKTQAEIARQLKLSQPTVSRHINTGKDITNKILSYCYYSVKKANEQWIENENRN